MCLARGEAAPMLDGLVATVAVRERCQVALVEAETMDRGKKWRWWNREAMDCSKNLCSKNLSSVS